MTRPRGPLRPSSGWAQVAAERGQPAADGPASRAKTPPLPLKRGVNISGPHAPSTRSRGSTKYSRSMIADTTKDERWTGHNSRYHRDVGERQLNEQEAHARHWNTVW